MTEPGSLFGQTDRGDDRAALTVGEVTLRRTELFGAAAAVAERVHGAPVVAVHADASASTVVAILGCLLAGVPVVPVPPDSGPKELAHIIRDSGATVWLGEGSPGEAGPEVVPVDLAARSMATHPAPDAASTAMIMYTSGTTGSPKGVVMSHGALAAGLDGLAEAWSWTAQDVLVHGLPLFHVHGLILGVLGPLRVGSPLVHTERPRPAGYASAAAGHGGTIFFGVPTVWSRIAAEPDCARALSTARLLVSGSAALPPSVFRDVAALAGQPPVERYGMTETMITVAVRSDGERRPGWVGVPIDGVETRVVDDAGVPVVRDGETIGDLQVRGPCLFDGYLGRPETTAESWTEDGWFRTGDAAVLDEVGYHRIVGRRSSDLIKSGGYRIGAGEVEAALLDHPAVAEAAVVGVPDPDLGQRIVAYVVAEGAGEADLISHVASQLSVHKRPREVRLVESLPRNAMGKVQKARLV
ncbi:acyl-CoA synthetase [Pseudonocardia spinosispora]|uniref:acyl-CoA synthetase n=1 Tax=Pseudonocardia spinosispora TaxID=103441 RepID=UPI0003F6A8C4|nr:acyl-CoA synthetase [Pseudonocardia spinosispora]